MALKNLREFELTTDQKKGENFKFSHLVQLVDACPKLEKVIFRPVFVGHRRPFQTLAMKMIVALHTLQGKHYLENHPNRKVHLVLDVPQAVYPNCYSYDDEEISF